MTGGERGDQAILESIACAIADGHPVDWSDAEEKATSDRTRLLLKRLRAAARVATAHRVPSGNATLPAPPESPRSAEPTRWGSLAIVSRIGGGAFGDVFVARDPALDRDVALKLLKPDAPGARPSDDRVVTEGRALARVRHGNVVTVFGADRRDGRVGIWMELVHGRTLEEILVEHGPLGAKEAAGIGADLCRALAAVHAEGLVHADVKTQNVVREIGGRILLMDFGASALARSDDAPPDDEEAVNAGTPHYMAPELFRGSPVSARTDLYSLGVLLYRLVTGSYPVTGTTLVELIGRHAAARPRPLRDLRPDLPADFVAAVEKAIAPDPAERYASAGEMERALASTAGVALRSRRTRLVAALAAAALVLAAGAIYLAARPGWGAYRVTARLFKLEGDAKRPLVSGDAVARGDRLFLEFHASRALHVYVVNEDAAGARTVLFPTKDTLQNPLPEREDPFVLPKDEMHWRIDTSAGAEDILIVASPTAMPALIEEIAAIPRAGEATTRLRGILGLEEGPDARALATASGRLCDAVQALAEGSESVTGVFVRKIRLDNPANREGGR